jgi:transcriptional repressor NrdR
MRCPWCDADDDRVVDSRPADGGTTIRRRRACTACGRRYTTFERIEEVGLFVVKRDGTKEPFSREKLAAGIRNALADRPVSPPDVEQMVDRIQGRLRRRGPEVSSQFVGGEVLTALRRTDEVAYLRFASVYKDFEAAADFERELVSLQKKVPAKRRTSG